MTNPLEDEQLAAASAVAGPRHGGSILMAAMLGLGQALGMDDQDREVPVAVMNAPAPPPGMDLDFGDLDPLDP